MGPLSYCDSLALIISCHSILSTPFSPCMLGSSSDLYHHPGGNFLGHHFVPPYSSLCILNGVESPCYGASVHRLDGASSLSNVSITKATPQILQKISINSGPLLAQLQYERCLTDPRSSLNKYAVVLHCHPHTYTHDEIKFCLLLLDTST